MIADDSALYRVGLQRAIEAHNELELVGVAADGDEALKLILDVEPDVALLDLRMPGRDGIEVAEAMAGGAGVASTRVVIVTSGLDADAQRRASAAGIELCLSKAEPRHAICTAVVALARG